MESQTITHLRRAAGNAAASPRAYHVWCLDLAEMLMRNAVLVRADRERLAGVIQAIEACGHADQLLIVPLDRWVLFAAAEQDLTELWSRYDRGSGTDVQAG